MHRGLVGEAAIRPGDPDIDAPPAWGDAAGEVLRRGWRKVMVIGAADVGKSSFCRFLSGRLLAAGARVAYVDSDIGQKDVGPPATVTLGYLPPGAATLGCGSIAPAGFYFVGSTSPPRHLLPLVVGTARLAGQAAADVVIVNTTGMVAGPGRTLKAYKIDAVRPDAIVAIERAAELQPILAAHAHLPRLRLSPSPQARTKGDRVREAARTAAFARHFAAARRHTFALADLVLQRMEALAGLGRPEAAVGLLCGVADRSGDGIGLAVIQALDRTGGTIVLLTPVPRDRVRVVQFGTLHLAAAALPVPPAAAE